VAPGSTQNDRHVPASTGYPAKEEEDEEAEEKDDRNEEKDDEDDDDDEGDDEEDVEGAEGDPRHPGKPSPSASGKHVTVSARRALRLSQSFGQ
jgi:ABC-type Zn2+ transport system substrate-binding protein/surface adhesin